MTVRITKPEFNLREKISELDKPSGLKGNELLRSETTQEARDFIGAGRKNLFINGALNIAQRGNSIASGFVYSMDQWFLMNHGSTTTRETSSPPEGFTYYARFASAGTVIFQQNLELPKTGDAGYLQGKTVTVSFYARTETSATAYVYANFRNGAGGGDHTGIFSGTNEISVLTPSWKRYSRTFTISATPHANNKCMAVMVRNPSGQTSGTWEITGLQMEFGSTTTEFDHRPVAEELALCERYYEVHWQNTNTNNPAGSHNDGYNCLAAGVNLGSYSYFALKYRTQKRAGPTISYSGKFRIIGSGSGSNKVPDEFYSPSIDGCRIRVPASGTSGEASVLEFDAANSSTGYIAISAEL
tara:strand:- start:180 stop:1250 length:1071 start_codon:yes stop_codon:yes gene_type:complete